MIFREKIFVKILFFCLVAFSLLSGYQRVSAQANTTINFQSKIVTRPDGLNITSSTACVLSGPDTCDFQVRIYDMPSGGTLLFEETHSNVELGDTSGIFNLSINSTCTGSWSAPATPCSGAGIDWGTDPTLYIEVEFDSTGTGTFGGTEIFSRLLLRSVPFAYYSDSAGSVVGGLDTVYANDSDKILNVNNSAGLEFVSTTSGNIRFDLQSSGDLVFSAQSTNAFVFNDQGGFEVLLNSTTNPSISIQNQGTSTALVLNETGASSPNLLDLQVSSLSRFQITNDGRIESNINGTSQAFSIVYNTNSTVADSLLISNSGTGEITTAINLSDSNIKNALDIGDNNIQMNVGGTVSINNSIGNQVVQVTDIATNFGGAVESGAFVTRNSYVGEEWSRFRATTNPAPSTNAVWGDFQSFSVTEQGPSGTNDCSFGITTGGIGGLGRITNVQTNVTCNAFHGTSATASNLIFRSQNLPLIMSKLRPSTMAGISTIRVGISDTNTATNAEPANGIYFTTVGGVWTGVTRASSVSTVVTCTGQTVSTTNFATFKIETRSTSEVRFYIDNDMSNGLQWFDCGTSSTNIPTVGMTSMLKWTGGAANAFLEFDHYRVWQDDASPTVTPIYEPSEHKASETILDLQPIEIDEEKGYFEDESKNEFENNDFQITPVSMPVRDYIHNDKVESDNGFLKLVNNTINLDILTFQTQKLSVSGELFVSGSVSIGGNLKIDGNIDIVGRLSLGQDNFAKLQFNAGEKSKEYFFEQELSSIPFISATQTTGNPVKFAIINKTKSSFEIMLGEEASENIEFEILIIDKSN